MAINKKILTKIAEKTKSDIAMQKNIENVLAGIEEGRQGKRMIDKIIMLLLAFGFAALNFDNFCCKFL